MVPVFVLEVGYVVVVEGTEMVLFVVVSVVVEVVLVVVVVNVAILGMLILVEHLGPG